MRKIQVTVVGVSTLVYENLLTLKENGDYEKHYNADMSLRVEDIQADTDAVIAKDAKEAKTKALDDLVITHNTVAYDAHGRAIGNMSAVMGVANFKFNQLLAQDVLPSDAYIMIYKETTIWWRGADDTNHEVMIESVCETLELSMMAVAGIVVI